MSLLCACCRSSIQVNVSLQTSCAVMWTRTWSSHLVVWDHTSSFVPLCGYPTNGVQRGYYCTNLLQYNAVWWLELECWKSCTNYGTKSYMTGRYPPFCGWSFPPSHHTTHSKGLEVYLRTPGVTQTQTVHTICCYIIYIIHNYIYMYVFW